MAKLTWRDPYPGETCFGGGSGILIPFNPNRMRSSKPPSTPPGSESEGPMLPMALKFEEQMHQMVAQIMAERGLSPSEPSASISAKPSDKN